MAFLRILEPHTSTRLQGLGFLEAVEVVEQSGVAQIGFESQLWHLLAL